MKISEFDANVDYYYETLSRENEADMDGLFFFIWQKLNRTKAHYESDDFEPYPLDKHHLGHIRRAHVVATSICDDLRACDEPDFEEVNELFDLLKESPHWWD